MNAQVVHAQPLVGLDGELFRRLHAARRPTRSWPAESSGSYARYGILRPVAVDLWSPVYEGDAR